MPVVEGGTGAQTLTGVLIGNGTSAVTGNAITQYDVLVGGASNAVSSVGPGTSGQVLQSGGNAANPAYSTATYPATTTINQLLYSSATNTVGGVTAGNYGVLISSSAGVPSWLANGTTGQVLTATTSGTPGWAAASGGIVTINGNSGSVTGSTVTIDTTGTNITFVGSSTTLVLGMAGDANNNILIGTAGTISSGSKNVALGYIAGAKITSGTNNTAVGYESMASGTVTGSNNTAIGYESCINLTSGASNVAIGASTMVTNTVTGSSNVAIGPAAMRDASSDSNCTAVGAAAGRGLNGSSGQNTLIGNSAGYPITTGSYNTFLGANTGTSYTSSESSNIILGYNTIGTAAESHVLRIGVATGTSNGYLNSAYICGIRGITSASSDQLLAVNSSNQIASIGAGTAGQVLTSNGSGSAPSFQAASSAGSWVLLQTQTASGSPTTISFTSQISATYNSYVLTWSNVQPSTTASPTLVVSTNNGSSWISSGYLCGTLYAAYNSATTQTGSSTAYAYLGAGSTNTGYSAGQVFLSNVSNGSPFLMNGTSFASGNNSISLIGGTNTATNVNAIQLAFGTTGYTFNSGTFTLYGIVGS
jgi:hypothetical protein